MQSIATLKPYNLTKLCGGLYGETCINYRIAMFEIYALFNKSKKIAKCTEKS